MECIMASGRVVFAGSLEDVARDSAKVERLYGRMEPYTAGQCYVLCMPGAVFVRTQFRQSGTESG
jgi:hypothetical protein